ncbi:phytoene/squalene synthase family protein [Flavobacteriaceae bacterium]|nr:phytoene/squalene synthase family protein [Flavobacteriaceae bacterium]
MKILFDQVSYIISESVTKKYSTSFSSAVKMLGPNIRQDIHAIYGFVRLADEIVDSFHDFDKRALLDEFQMEYVEARKRKISMNPVMHAFVLTVEKYNIPDQMVYDFLSSMRLDLEKTIYDTQEEYEKYIYGSADVVGLMCLKVFVEGDDEAFNRLKSSAMRLGSAFQKVNFLRDLKDDYEILNRSYFPNVNFDNLSVDQKNRIIQEINDDFEAALVGIKKLPASSRFGVYTAYKYYRRLLLKLNRTPSEHILTTRIRVSDPVKLLLLTKSYVNFKLNLI